MQIGVEESQESNWQIMSLILLWIVIHCWCNGLFACKPFLLCVTAAHHYWLDEVVLVEAEDEVPDLEVWLLLADCLMTGRLTAALGRRSEAGVASTTGGATHLPSTKWVTSSGILRGGSSKTVGGYFEVTPIDECHLVRCLGWDSTGGPCSTAPAFAVGFGFGRTCKALDLEGVASGALTTESAPFPLPLVSAPFPLYLHEGAKNILGGGGGGSPGIMSQNASHIIYMGVHWCSICIWITLHVFTGIHWCSIFISLGPTLILFSTDEHGTKLFKCV